MKLPIDEIRPNPNNPRIIKDVQYKKLVQSLKDFPVMLKKLRKIVVDEDNIILGGNMRYRAVIEAGIKELDVEVFTRADAEENNKLAKELDPDFQDKTYEEYRQEFIIKDNVSGGEWNWDILANEWDTELLDDWGIDLPAQFGVEEVEEDEAPEVRSEPPVSQLGVVYQLGRHRVMCGDSTVKDNVDILMNGNYADFCFTSPPYSDMRDYGGGDMSVEKIASFLSVDNCGFYAVNLGLQRKDNAINRYWDQYIEVAEARDLKLTAWNIWSKRGMGGSIANMSAMFPIEHEWILVFGGDKGKINRTKKNKTAGLHTNISNRQKDGSTKKVSPKNVRSYGVMGSVYEGVYAVGEKEHPAVYPIHLPAEYINACTQKGDIVYEPFTGSGTNVIACEQTDRICYGMELDEKYLDVIRKRWAKYVYPDRWEKEWEILTPAIEKL